VSEFQPPQPDEDNLRRIGELIVGLSKPGIDVYIEIAVCDGEEPAWEYTELPHE
jgi:hypothetical protein